MSRPRLSLSIVSHGHAAMLPSLLGDLRALCDRWPPGSIELLLTFNFPEDSGFLDAFADLPLRTHTNARPAGFGANQNAAFRRARGERFAIVNPDIRIHTLDLGALLSQFDGRSIGAVAPRVVSGDGALQDNARCFPTVGRLAWRALSGRFDNDYAAVGSPIEVDWVAGMFVVFDRIAWQAVDGFDERFFMYFEDVDLCRRLRRAGWSVLYQSATEVIHDAQRASHRDPVHLRWHLRSAVRYFVGL